jgi:glyoxylase-like metal-dependent hydrolase (beta-lactamase superfamily II)
MTTRRSMLKGTASIMLGATALSALSPLEAFARAAQIKTPAPAYHRMMLGDLEITALSDGTVKIPLNTLYNHTTPDHIDRVLAGVFQSSPSEASVNAYLVNTNERLVLIDAGTGAYLGPTLGKLIENIRAAGYQPEQIDDVLLTHIHTDHSGGLLVGGKRAFPNASLHINKRDVDYWLNPANARAAPDVKKALYAEAMEAVTPYIDAGKLKTFTDNAEPIPGFKTILRAGHTPGHSSIVLESQGKKLVIWGDITHGDVVQFDEPGIAIAFDEDSEKAIISRQRAFAEAADEGYLVAGAHISFPGIGHVRRDRDNYDWVPLNYSSGI